MSDPLARFAQSIAGVVQSGIRDHERRMHAPERRRGIPPPNRRRLTDIPYPDYEVDDDVLAHAVELLNEGMDLPLVAYSLEIPQPALERHLAEYKRRYGRFLFERATAW
jgi:hypothetical protein